MVETVTALLENPLTNIWLSGFSACLAIVCFCGYLMQEMRLGLLVIFVINVILSVIQLESGLERIGKEPHAEGQVTTNNPSRRALPLLWTADGEVETESADVNHKDKGSHLP